MYLDWCQRSLAISWILPQAASQDQQKESLKLIKNQCIKLTLRRMQGLLAWKWKSPNSITELIAAPSPLSHPAHIPLKAKLSGRQLCLSHAWCYTSISKQELSPHLPCINKSINICLNSCCHAILYLFMHFSQRGSWNNLEEKVPMYRILSFLKP